MDVTLVVSVLSISTVFITSIWIVLEKREPTSTLAWIFAVVFLPYIGLLLYLVFGRRRIKRKTRKLSSAVESVRESLPASEKTAGVKDDHAQRVDVNDHEPLVRLANRIAEEPVTLGNRTRILVNAQEKYPALLEAIGRAEKFVHVEYYIVRPDSAGRRLRDALLERAKAGVKVRFLFDYVGSWTVGDDFLAPLRDAGAECASFLPVRIPASPFRFRWNFRNHRKVVVIDGKVGFTGGINIGEEYEGKDKRLGKWRDTHLEIEGPAVRSLERLFNEDWSFATGERIEGSEYFPSEDPTSNELVQIIPSGPDREWRLIHLQTFQAIANAQERCWITTPYFVPDQALRTAMVAAALRGVNVRLLLPRKSDMRLVLWAGRSYYGELLRAGVKIYEYDDGFLHAKTMVVDSSFGTIGSANMDIRSFRLNFEVNAFVYSERFAEQLEEIFEQDIGCSLEIELEQYQERPWYHRLAESMARLWSPLL